MTKDEARKVLMDLLVFKCDRCPEPRKTTSACEPCEYYPQIRACGKILANNEKRKPPVRSSYKKWTEKEDKYLLENATRKSFSEIGAKLGRSYQSTYYRYLRLTSRSAK